MTSISVCCASLVVFRLFEFVVMVWVDTLLRSPSHFTHSSDVSLSSTGVACNRRVECGWWLVVVGCTFSVVDSLLVSLVEWGTCVEGIDRCVRGVCLCCGFHFPVCVQKKFLEVIYFHSSNVVSKGLFTPYLLVGSSDLRHSRVEFQECVSVVEWEVKMALVVDEVGE